MRVTLTTSVQADEAAKFWGIYDAAFGKLRIASPCRQFMYEHEFMQEMTDERMLKFVLRDESAVAVGMALVATDLAAIDWISPEYFSNAFPEHYREQRIFYFGALLVEPGSQGQDLSRILLDELVAYVIRNDGIAAFDCYAGNNVWMPDFIAETVLGQGNFAWHELEHQYYYAFEAKGFTPERGPGTLFRDPGR